MTTILIICSVVAVIMVSVVCSAHAAPQQQPPPPTPAVTQADVAAMPDEQIRRMLGNLDQHSVQIAAREAMCYVAAPPPDRVEYVCPKCGEKTLFRSKKQVEFIFHELFECRTAVSEISTNAPFKCTLGESGMCAKCIPAITNRIIALLVVHANGTTNRTENVTLHDLRLIRDYLDKKTMVPSEAIEQRLRQLVGTELIDSQPVAIKQPMSPLRQALDAKRDKLQQPSQSAHIITQKDIAALPDNQMRQLVSNLGHRAVRAPLRVDPTPYRAVSASCYVIATPSKRVEYVCQKCGEKTLYQSENQVGFIDGELAACRAAVTGINTNAPFACTLDESALCAKCTPKAVDRTVALVVVQADGTTNRTANVGLRDLRLIRDYLDRKTTVTGDDGTEVSITQRMPRLRQILGLDEQSTTNVPATK